MKNTLILTVVCLMLSSCGTTSLYYWGGNRNSATAYEHFAYKSYDKQTPESICRLIGVYESMIRNPKGTRNMPPPGICAEYGYLLLQPDTAEKFAQHASFDEKDLFSTSDYVTLFRQRGAEMLEKEIEYYPESATFVLPLIKRLTE